ncbi:MAG TPA: BamA/TamA family outer membrane protein, partial [Candidatus Dormibacteraeota bacterium]|nr:BamA/TamA family outer membrane protein [Candidatus Dormibacteraeota bacterium]
RVGLTYGYTNTSITGLSTAATALFNVLQFQQLEGPSSLQGIRESKITPTLSYNTVDNPMNPTHGKSLFISSSFEGGPIGGNVNTVSEIAEAKYFHPTYHNRNVIALRVMAAYESGFGGKVIPPFSRFYLGGEDTLRGFDIRTVSPVVFVPTLTNTSVSYTDPTRLNSLGNPTVGTITIPTLSYQTSFPGGDTEAVANLEYRIPIAPHVSASLFADAGATGALRANQLQLNSTDYSTLIQQFPATSINRTLSFQPGTNFKLRSSLGVELVVQLPIVQAPFRLYWAYNLTRMGQIITAPQTQFPGSIDQLTSPNPSPWDPYKNQAPYPEVWNSQVAPQILNLYNNPQRTNFFDPVRTLRFTVSRTF